MAVEFYNPGHRINEMMRFDHPTNDDKQMNNVSYFVVDAPEHGYFEIPSEVEVQTEQGPVQISVKFADRIQRDFREYGVVRIVDPKKVTINEDDNTAADKKSAKEKGERLWSDYLVAKAREHIQNVETTFAIGGIPQRARGDFAHALKMLNMEDPADKVGVALSRAGDTETVKDLKAQIEELRGLVLAGAKGK